MLWVRRVERDPVPDPVRIGMKTPGGEAVPGAAEDLDHGVHRVVTRARVERTDVHIEEPRPVGQPHRPGFDDRGGAGGVQADEAVLTVGDDFAEHAAVGDDGGFGHGHGFADGAAGAVAAGDEEDFDVEGSEHADVVFAADVAGEVDAGFEAVEVSLNDKTVTIRFRGSPDDVSELIEKTWDKQLRSK